MGVRKRKKELTREGWDGLKANEERKKSTRVKWSKLLTNNLGCK
jgi:hypothetical protein